MDTSLPPPVRGFITSWIHSVEQLETLCLLSEAPSRAWSARQVLARIQSSEKAVADNLERFAKGGLLVTEGEHLYRFSPRRRGLRSLMAQVARVYRERPVSIINAIYAHQTANEALRPRPEPGGNNFTGHT